MGLFKKAAIFTDIHWGLRNDSELHNQDCLEFIEWFAAQTVEQGCDTIIFGGDWYHNRIRTENRTAHYSRIGIEILDSLKLPIFWIIGNHDIYFRDSRDVISLYLSKHRNIHVIDTITKIDDVVFSPWLVGEEHQDLITRQATYCWGHFQLPLFLLNQSIEYAYDGHGLHTDDFVNFEAVYSGHFHKRQVRKNKHDVPIFYIGNAFAHDFNDVNDPERGMATMKWGELLPEYMAWPDAPTYHRFDISNFAELIRKGEKPYGPRASIELIDDIGLPDNEIAELKGMVKARQIRIRKTKVETRDEQVSDITKYASLDEMVETKLATMNYDGRYDPSLLVKLYRSV